MPCYVNHTFVQAARKLSITELPTSVKIGVIYVVEKTVKYKKIGGCVLTVTGKLDLNPVTLLIN